MDARCEAKETVVEILRERRAMYTPHERRGEPGWRQVCETKWAFYDRILAAHEREMAAKDAEIARLKAALKPVLEARVRDVWGVPTADGGMRVSSESVTDMVHLVAAVREARDIYNGGEDND